jgi:broad specificity phosphatase PhoE
MITIYLGRHGETRLNSEDCLRGWIDVPLNKDGIREAHAMAAQMKQYPIDRIYCSDLDRADHTAQIVAKEHDLMPIPRQWFRPLDYGDLNGKPLKDIQPLLDKLNEIWKTNPDHEAPHGESFREFQDRNLGGMHAIIRAAKEGEQIMLVAHLRNCLLFHAVALSGGPVQGDAIQLMDGKSWHQESGAVSQFEWDGQLKFVGLLDAKAVAV